MAGTVLIADLHQDLWSHVEAREVFGDVYQTSFPLIEDSPIGLVVASTFNMHDGARVTSAYSVGLMDRYRRKCEEPGWKQVLSANDLQGEDSRASRRLLVHVEGIGGSAGPVEERLQSWWERGCRSIGPMWNLDNGLGGGPMEPRTPLSQLGLRAVRWIDERPMVLDLAHMGERTFSDTVGATSGTLVASHANARALCEHPRNLFDDQIRAIADRGGVVGIVLSKRFLGLTSDLEAALRHADHIAALVGPDYVGIGTDLGGLGDPIDDVDTVAGLVTLAERFEGYFGRATWRKIAWDNAVRAIRASLAP